MSRLLHPRLGDYWDRRSILELKIEDANARGVFADHFLRELDEIDQHLRSQGAVGVYAVRALKIVNARIWEATDRLLKLRTGWPRLSEPTIFEIAELGITILNLNEERAKLVQELNGGGAPEKVRS